MSYTAQWSSSSLPECGNATVAWTAPHGLTDAGLYVYDEMGFAKNISLPSGAKSGTSGSLSFIIDLPAGLQVGFMVYNQSGRTPEEAIATDNFAVTNFINITEGTSTSCLSPIGISLASSLSSSPSSSADDLSASSTSSPIFATTLYNTTPSSIAPYSYSYSYNFSIFPTSDTASLAAAAASTSSPTSASASSGGLSRTNEIVLGAVGGAVVLLLLGAGITWWCVRKPVKPSRSSTRDEEAKVGGSRKSRRRGAAPGGSSRTPLLQDGSLEANELGKTGKKRRKSEKGKSHKGTRAASSGRKKGHRHHSSDDSIV